jgi:hypothetical protein
MPFVAKTYSKKRTSLSNSSTALIRPIVYILYYRQINLLVKCITLVLFYDLCRVYRCTIAVFILLHRLSFLFPWPIHFRGAYKSAVFANVGCMHLVNLYLIRDKQAHYHNNKWQQKKPGQRGRERKRERKIRIRSKCTHQHAYVIPSIYDVRKRCARKNGGNRVSFSIATHNIQQRKKERAFFPPSLLNDF